MEINISMKRIWILNPDLLKIGDQDWDPQGGMNEYIYFIRKGNIWKYHEFTLDYEFS